MQIEKRNVNIETDIQPGRLSQPSSAGTHDDLLQLNALLNTNREMSIPQAIQDSQRHSGRL